MVRKDEGSCAVKRRILLIDDAPDNLEVLTILLEDKYDVLSYGSSQEALLALPYSKPELLLLDVAMSPVNGLDLLREIRGMGGFCNIPAIAVTAFARDLDKERFLAAGFQSIVTKPILDVSSMEAIIDRLLQSTNEEGSPIDGGYPLTA